MTRDAIIDAIDDLYRCVQNLEEENSKLKSEITDLESNNAYLEKKLEAREDPASACEKFLAELDRPCGARKFTIPDNTRVHDAIREMADAIGRNI